MRELTSIPAANTFVLVVDDEPDAREMLSIALRDAGFQTMSAANGAEALTILKETVTSKRTRCGLILLDLMMPVLNGWDFRRKQKSDPALAGIPVVLMSAGAHIAAATGDLDAAGSVAKPVELSDLVAKVRRYRR
jgi:CheY-like chemotaxis protein